MSLKKMRRKWQKMCMSSHLNRWGWSLMNGQIEFPGGCRQHVDLRCQTEKVLHRASYDMSHGRYVVLIFAQCLQTSKYQNIDFLYILTMQNIIRTKITSHSFHSFSLCAHRYNNQKHDHPLNNKSTYNIKEAHDIFDKNCSIGQTCSNFCTTFFCCTSPTVKIHQYARTTHKTPWKSDGLSQITPGAATPCHTTQ